VLLLPVMNTVIIPVILLLTFRDARSVMLPVALEAAARILALVVGIAGLMLANRSIALFVRRGRGTLAPWDPTRVLIANDVYRFSRNPMKSGLFLILLAECLMLRSPALAVWTAGFIVVNVLYIRLHEEVGLRRRFGADYLRYCQRVPRWFPRRSGDGQLREGLS
jgi:protein-S-isoprenylcysteine O-methyltransferase Ste14